MDCRGHLDYIECFGKEIYATGWLWNPERPTERLCTDIVSAGKSVCRVTGNRFRPDLPDAGIGDGRHAFIRAYIGNYEKLRFLKTLRLQPDGYTTVLQQKDPEIFLRPEQAFKGRIDSVEIFWSLSRIKGWLWNTQVPEQQYKAIIKAADHIVAEVPATEFRGDLQRAGIGKGSHAFTAIIDTTLLGRDIMELQLYANQPENPVLQKGEFLILRKSLDHPETFRLMLNKGIQKIEQGDYQSGLRLFSKLSMVNRENTELKEKLESALCLYTTTLQHSNTSGNNTDHEFLNLHRHHLLEFNSLLSGLDEELED